MSRHCLRGSEGGFDEIEKKAHNFTASPFQTIKAGARASLVFHINLFKNESFIFYFLDLSLRFIVIKPRRGAFETTGFCIKYGEWIIVEFIYYNIHIISPQRYYKIIKFNATKNRLYQVAKIKHSLLAT